MESVWRVVFLVFAGFGVGLSGNPVHAQSLQDGNPLINSELPLALTPFVAPNIEGSRDGGTAALHSVRLDALLVEGGEPLEHGLVWRVFERFPDETGKLPMVASSRGGQALFEFEPGEYYVHVAFGLAGVTRKLVIHDGAPIDNQNFILNAGGLILNAVSGNDVGIPAAKLRFSIFSEEHDSNGQRQLIIGNVRPNQVVRLNDGIYHVVSEYGSFNAVIRSDIRLQAGSMTEATIQHRAAQLTFKLVAEAGGEAIADTAWSITNSAGDVISESVSAFPSLVLAEGEYTAIARHKEQLFRRDFQVVAGRNTDVEVLLGY